MNLFLVIGIKTSFEISLLNEVLFTEIDSRIG